MFSICLTRISHSISGQVVILPIGTLTYQFYDNGPEKPLQVSMVDILLPNDLDRDDRSSMKTGIHLVFQVRKLRRQL